MTALGYVEGENITYLYDGPIEIQEELGDAAANFVEANVDMILAFSTPAALAAQKATAATGIPVVFAPVTDPVGPGLVASISEPGGNVTGISNGRSEQRRMEWFLELVPDAKRFYVPYNSTDPSAVAALTAAQTAADELDVELVPQPATVSSEMIEAINNIPDDVDAVYMLPDGLAINHMDQLVTATIERRLPLSGPTADLVAAGALLSFGIDFRSVGEQAARLADQILRGSDPAVLPVEEGEFFLVINLTTAEAIGLEIDDSILQQAYRIIRE
jgi:putative ABC transport system substrate-binding protein